MSEKLPTPDKPEEYDPSTAADFAVTGSLSDISEAIGESIGPYKLMQVIGEGGMGTVYMAEQERPIKRRVALKVIKPGMDSKEIVARFEAERQALSMMEHANIANVLDVGTTEKGLPYFVMELIIGVPITKYCDKKSLTVEQRLQLFQSVCNAVQHAHQKGIIHRDLKPSNILVAEYDGEAVPKIIDFGLAKALHQKLTERTMFTQLGQVVGTVEYMSPEQSSMNQLEIDTRTDVYSLGVLLYELLTGTVPFDRKRLRSAAWDQVMAIIREEEPPKPSQRISTVASSVEVASNRGIEVKRLGLLLRGDLDWIVMKALEKDRNRRYETAIGFGRDVSRYLNQEPIEARPPSTWYRFQKAVSKHRIAFSVAATVFMLLLLGVIGTSLGLARARIAEQQAIEEKDEADRQRERADQEAFNARQAEAIARESEQAAIQSQRTTEAALEVERLAARQLYQKQTQLADNAWEFGEAGDALSSLNDTRVDFRGWEYDFLAAKFARNQHNLLGHTSAIYKLVLSPDGERLASASWDGSARLWDFSTGEQIAEYRVPGDQFTCIDFHPSDNAIAFGGNQGTIYLLDLADGSVSGELAQHDSPLNDLAFSPDGSSIASCDRDQLIHIWDVDLASVTTSISADIHDFLCLDFTPDSQHVVAGSEDSKVHFYDVANGALIRTLAGHSDAVSCLAIAVHGDRLVTGSYDKTARLWNLSTGETIQEYVGHSGYLQAVAMSDDQSKVATCGRDKRVHLWDLESGDLIGKLTGHTDSIESVVFANEDRFLLSCSYDFSIKRWDLDQPELLRDHRTISAHDQMVSSVAASPNGKQVASVSKDQLKLWDPNTGELIHDIICDGGDINFVEFSPDSTRVLTTNENGSVGIYDTETGASVGKLIGHTEFVYGVRYSPDGKYIATASKDRTVKYWESESSNLLYSFQGHETVVYEARFTSDGRYIISTGTDQSIRVWDTQTTSLSRSFENVSQEFKSANLSPDDRLLIYGDSRGVIRFFDLEQGEVTFSIDAHQQMISGIEVFSNGNQFATSAWDKTIKIWDFHNRRSSLSLSGFDEPISCLASSADGTLIVAGGLDGKVKVWDASPTRYVTPSEASHWTRQGMRTVRNRDASVDQLETVLARCELALQSYSALQTQIVLGATLYRLGHSADALTILEQHASLDATEFDTNEDYAMFLGFLAMTHSGVANDEDATELQTQLRRWMEENGLDQSRSMVRLLAEVDEVLQASQ